MNEAPLTLITFLGGKRGKNEKGEEVYQTAEYLFDEATTVVSAYFGDALMRSGKYPITGAPVWKQDLDLGAFGTGRTRRPVS